jgi:hypothetical protein
MGIGVKTAGIRISGYQGIREEIISTSGNQGKSKGILNLMT